MTKKGNLDKVMEPDTIQKNKDISKDNKCKVRIFKSVCFTLFVVCIFFSGCENKDDDDNGNENEISENLTFDGKTLIAKVEYGENYDSKVRTIKAITWDNDGEEYLVTEGSYSNGGFMLDLPESFPTTVNDIFLKKVEDWWFAEEEYDLNINNKDVRLLIIFDFVGYNNDGVYFDRLDYVKYIHNNNYTWAEFWYVDNDLTISGSTSDYRFNLSLKRGWNILYCTYTPSGHEEYFTQLVEGLKWYFDNDSPIP